MSSGIEAALFGVLTRNVEVKTSSTDPQTKSPAARSVFAGSNRAHASSPPLPTSSLIWPVLAVRGGSIR
jgi:hypothetical protein